MQGENLCFSLGTNQKSQTAIGLCLNESTSPTAYYVQESEKVLLLKGATDKDYLLMENSTSLMSTVVGNKFDSIFFKQRDCCGPSMCETKDNSNSTTVCTGKTSTSSYVSLMNGMRFGDPDNGGGYVGVSYYLVSKGSVLTNVAQNFISVFDGQRVFHDILSPAILKFCSVDHP